MNENVNFFSDGIKEYYVCFFFWVGRWTNAQMIKLVAWNYSLWGVKNEDQGPYFMCIDNFFFFLCSGFINADMLQKKKKIKFKVFKEINKLSNLI